MQNHLGLEAFEQLVHHSCDVSLAYGWLLHLLACERCRSSFIEAYPAQGKRLLREVFDTQRPVELPELKDPEKVDRILEHLKHSGLARFLEGLSAPTGHLAELEAHPPLRQKLLVVNSRRFHRLEVVQELLERSKSLWHDDPRRAVHLADLALAVLSRLSPAAYHPKVLEDLRGLAWGFLGNGQRVMSQLDEAERSLRRALEHLERGTGDPLETAHLCSLLSSLRTDQDRYDEALALNRRAGGLYRRIGDEPKQALTEAKQLNILNRSGRSEEVLRRRDAVMERYDLDSLEPAVSVTIRQQIALALGRCGWTLPAQGMLRELRAEAQQMGRLGELRIRWAEAELLEKAGMLAEAEDRLRYLREAFTRHEIELDAALLTLHLAKVYRKQHRRRRARRAARRALQSFTRARLTVLSTEARQILAGA